MALLRPCPYSITEAEASADRAGPHGHQPLRGQLRRSRAKHQVDGGLVLDLVVISHDRGLTGALAQLEMLLQRRDGTACVRVPLVIDPVRWRGYHRTTIVLHRLRFKSAIWVSALQLTPDRGLSNHANSEVSCPPQYGGDTKWLERRR